MNRENRKKTERQNINTKHKLIYKKQDKEKNQV